MSNACRGQCIEVLWSDVTKVRQKNKQTNKQTTLFIFWPWQSYLTVLCLTLIYSGGLNDFFLRSKVLIRKLLFISQLHQCDDFLNFPCHFLGAVLPAPSLDPHLSLLIYDNIFNAIPDFKGETNVFFSRKLKGVIESLFDPCVNAMGGGHIDGHVWRWFNVPPDLAQSFGAICAHYRYHVIHRVVTNMCAWFKSTRERQLRLNKIAWRA